MRISVPVTSGFAPDHYRQRLPVRHLAGPLAAEGIELVGGGLAEDADAVLWPRVPPPEVLARLRRMADRGARVWYATDDLIGRPGDVPAWNPYCLAAGPQGMADADARLAELLGFASGCVVSTEPLAAAMRERFGGPVLVAPNLVDAREWPEPQPREEGKCRLAWVGSIHHDMDLEQVLGPLHMLLQNLPNVEVAFMGLYPLSMAAWARQGWSRTGILVPNPVYGGRLHFVDPVPLEQYPAVASGIRADVWLAPLEECPFNASKSALRYYEAGMAGAAFIGTDIDAYSEVRPGVTGLLVRPGDSQGWLDACKFLIADAGLRRRLAEAGRQDVLENHTWQRSAEGRAAWMSAFRRIAAG